MESSVAKPPFDLNLGDEDDSTALEKFENLANLISSKKNIVVLVGAGISTACGIPDFRTKGSGLYSTIENELEDLGLSCAEDLFDYDFFRENPVPFYLFSKSLFYPLGGKKRAKPSASHLFLSQLEKSNRLLRVYSQNIDGLEEVAGVSKKKIIYAHGSLNSLARCLKCRRRVEADYLLPAVEKGEVPICRGELNRPMATTSPSPIRKSLKRRTKKQSRNESGDGDNMFCNGVLKPGVVFFGETLQENVGRFLEVDKKKADLLLVIGTSLSVAPISKVIEYLPHIPRVLINRTFVQRPSLRVSDIDEISKVNSRGDKTFDFYLLGNCDDVTREIAKRLFRNGNDAREVAKGQKRKREVEPEETAFPGQTLGTFLCNHGERPDIEEWANASIPRTRTILFSGAVASAVNQAELDYREIVHCDGCSVEVTGTTWKCKTCFDFDLCELCFPKLSKSHFDGKHQFLSECPSTQMISYS